MTGSQEWCGGSGSSRGGEGRRKPRSSVRVGRKNAGAHAEDVPCEMPTDGKRAVKRAVKQASCRPGRRPAQQAGSLWERGHRRQREAHPSEPRTSPSRQCPGSLGRAWAGHLLTWGRASLSTKELCSTPFCVLTAAGTTHPATQTMWFVFEGSALLRGA